MNGRYFHPTGMRAYTTTHIRVIDVIGDQVTYVHTDEQRHGKERYITMSEFLKIYTEKEK